MTKTTKPAEPDQRTKNFEPVIKAIRQSQQNHWDIADAVLGVVGAPVQPGVTDGSGERLEELAHYLSTNKIVDFGVEYLRKLRDTAHRFPAGTRVPSVAFTVYVKLRNDADLLPEIIKRAGEEPLTVRLAQKICRKLRREAEKQTDSGVDHNSDEAPGKNKPKPKPRSAQPEPSDVFFRASKATWRKNPTKTVNNFIERISKPSEQQYIMKIDDAMKLEIVKRLIYALGYDESTIVNALQYATEAKNEAAD